MHVNTNRNTNRNTIRNTINIVSKLHMANDLTDLIIENMEITLFYTKLFIVLQSIEISSQNNYFRNRCMRFIHCNWMTHLCNILPFLMWKKSIHKTLRWKIHQTFPHLNDIKSCWIVYIEVFMSVTASRINLLFLPNVL